MATKIGIVLDRSGSMQLKRDDFVGGLRSFINDQKGKDGEARLTLIQFDTVDACEIVVDDVNIDDVDADKIDLIPRSGTPLLDAVGKSIAHIATKTTKNDDVIMMIITDGEENSSREWTRDALKQAIVSKEKEKWSFLFLGAGIDAFAEAGSFGVHQNTCASFSNVGNTYKKMSDKVALYRSAKSQNVDYEVMTSGLIFSKEDREEMNS